VEPHAGTCNLDHFVISSDVRSRRLKDYADVISGFLAEFNNFKPQFALFATPFDVSAESVFEEFQMEVLDFEV